MEIIYLAENDFNKIKIIEKFPNPNIVIGIFNNEKKQINKTCRIRVINEKKETLIYHNLTENSYILTSENGHFPTDLLMTVNNNRFFDGLKIGAKVGTNLGTASIGVVDVQKAIKILEKNNFQIEI